MDEDKLIMLVGLPRSGKSTWAKKKMHPIVNPDAVRLAVHGQPYIQESEQLVWAIVHYMVKALFGAGHNRVVLDATNTTRKRRDMWKSSNWRREFVVFDTPASVCLERVSAGGPNSEGLRGAIERMAEQYEPVGEDEGEILKVLK